MREVKFRVIAKVDNQCSSDDPAYYESIRKIYFELDDVIKSPFTIYDAFDLEGYDIIEILSTDQYIEVKDKVGKEIYGGDIIEDGDGNIDVVIFEDGKFCGSRYIYNPIFRWWGVIGNIHENPELLGD